MVAGLLIWLGCVFLVAVLWRRFADLTEEGPFGKRLAGWLFGAFYFAVLAAIPLALVALLIGDSGALGGAPIVGFLWAAMWLPIGSVGSPDRPFSGRSLELLLLGPILLLAALILSAAGHIGAFVVTVIVVAAITCLGTAVVLRRRTSQP